MFNKPKKFRDVVDELDRMVDMMEKEMEEAMKWMYEPSSTVFDHPFVYGFSVRVGPDGEPIVRTFGDKSLTDRTIREPVYDQIVDEEKGELRLVVELPGVEKEDIQLKSSQEDVTISAQSGERRYNAVMKLNIPVEPAKTTASFRNGILDVVFRTRGNANKGYTSIDVK
jgi:HSP20 family protein